MATIREMKQSPHETANEGAEVREDDLESMKGELHRLREKLKSNGAQLEDELRDAGERFSDGARKFSDAAVEQVRAHPLAAFGVAFAAGVVLSRLLRSR